MPHRDEATDHSSAFDSLPARYRGAAGWKPDKPYQKRRDKFVRSHPELFCHESLFEDRRQPAEDDDLGYDRPKIPTNPELFGTLWRRGELTVLCGPTGVGKTILAVQLAESIARGRRIEPSRAPASDEVLYLDLERTRAQHDERYSVPAPRGRRRREYKFSDRFHHIGLPGGGFTIPELFNGDLARYWQHSTTVALAATEARIIIIDSLASLDPKRGRSAQPRQLRSLKLHAATHNLSILVVASVIKPGSEIAEIADSMFMLAPSTMREDIRYIKPLKCNSAQPLLPEGQVLTYRLERQASLLARRSATENTENTEPLVRTGNGSDRIPNSPLSTINSQLPPPSPFLGFHFLGFADEEQHLLNYAAEARQIRNPHSAVRDRSTLSAKDALIQGMTDGSYLRYLKGE